MTLIYCAYNIIDHDTVPSWVEQLINNPIVKKEGWAVYSPVEGFTGNLERSIAMPAALTANELPKAVRKNYQALRLDPILLEPLGKAMPRLQAADESPTLDVPLKSLYVLLRSNVVLVDLNQPGYGESSQEVTYAYLGTVPIVGIAHRFILSPWMISKLNAVIFPRTTDEIVQQVLAHDHKTTVMLGHYRAERKEAERQQALARAERAAKHRAPRAARRNVGRPVLPPAAEPEPKPEVGQSKPPIDPETTTDSGTESKPQPAVEQPTSEQPGEEVNTDVVESGASPV